MTLSPGLIFHNGRYRIGSLLGQGGMGAVYRAWDTNLNIPVAIKENLDSSPEARKQFQREAQILARLSHPNLPRVIDHFIILDQGQYLVMDFVEGEDLASMLGRMGALPQDQTLNWILQICDALIYLHSQATPIIHRDIKPANIRIRPDGRAMLVDFGIAKIHDAHMITTVGAQAITPGYSPPEQYGGGTDIRSDIYSLGATFYHLLTGFPLPESVLRQSGKETARSPRRLNPLISPNIDKAIMKAVEISTDRRFKDMRDFQLALMAQAAPPKPPSSKTTIRFGAIALFALLLSCAFLAFYFGPRLLNRIAPGAIPEGTRNALIPPTNTPLINFPATPIQPTSALPPSATPAPGPTATGVPPTNSGIAADSPEAFIRAYYAALSDEQYELAFSWLTDGFKERHHCCNADGGYQYKPYEDWWKTIERIDVRGVTVLSQTAREAQVIVQCRYYFKDGRVVDDDHAFGLVKGADNIWRIDHYLN